MQFAIVAMDGGDADAPARRRKARADHLAGLKREKIDGVIIDGGAILDDAEQMIGSVVLCDVPDRAALDRYLADEPYMRSGVWKSVTIHPIRRVDWPNLLKSDD